MTTRASGPGWTKMRGAVALLGFFLAAALSFAPAAAAFTLSVVDEGGAAVSGFRWLVESDNTNQPVPGQISTTSISLSVHKSHARVVKEGHATGSQAAIVLPANQRYFVSVLPDGGKSLSGAPVAPYQGTVKVAVNSHPIPTAQITILAFVDQNPINNGWDEHELGLGGADVEIADFGGPVSQDAFGNPLGTRYDATGAVVTLGTGEIKTLTQDQLNGGLLTNPDKLKVGEAVIKNLAPGKYAVTVKPPHFDDGGAEMDWIQTTTIEGTPVIDAWVKANEPNVFIEGFGTGFKHAVFGFLKVGPATSNFKGQTFDILPWNSTPPVGATGYITGTLRWNHFAKPPANQGSHPGEPVPEGWVALVDPLAQPGLGQPAGLYATPCNPDGSFMIPSVPDGTYTLVWWDKPLDGLFGFASVTVAGGVQTAIGDLLVFRWFGTLEGTVFHDIDHDGFRDTLALGGTDEIGIPGQNLNLRFRDGSIYQTQPTDNTGEYGFTEVFPFFKWLVAEVDFTRYQATGMTTAVDNGGAIPLADGWMTPSFDKLNPQKQATINPNTGNNLSRTETGPVLTQAMHLFLNQTNVIDWGKDEYAPGENGGISGIVFYDTTRAENDPTFCSRETWQPGIPDVQVTLYLDNFNNVTGAAVPDGVIDDVNLNNVPERADVDNAPFGWARGGARGVGDIDRNNNGVFNYGDAVNIAYTDSWDRAVPTLCVQNLPVVHGKLAGACADNYSTWNQVRPGVFDGGYAFDSYVPLGLSRSRLSAWLTTGTYLVEAAPPAGYQLVKEEDKNVDFGDEYVPADAQADVIAFPPCVGNPHTVPAELTLFPGIAPEFAGQTRPLCDRKQVRVADSKNTAADFFFFTYVPKAARAVGFVNNDLAAEFNMASPNFGEKLSPSWLPVAFRDWTGREITRVYTDEFGGYNALLPSTYTMNVPAPSGVSPNMMTLVLNDPFLPNGKVDPFYNPVYSVTPWTFQYMPGTTTYLDTPLVALAAFAAHGRSIDTEPQTLTPVIKDVSGPEPGGGPLVCSDHPVGAPPADQLVTITSVGKKLIINPNYNTNVAGSTYRITRDYGFGWTPGKVTLDGTPLLLKSWTDTKVVVRVPTGTATGRLLVSRSSGATTEVGVTLNVETCETTPIVRVPQDFTTIQAAIDDPATTPGALILVGPGTYTENVILFKAVRLQGAGAGGTFIDGNPSPLDRLQVWHDRINAFGGRELAAFMLKDPFAESEAPTVIVFGEMIFPQGDIQFPGANDQVFNPGFPFSTPGQARVDGFTLSGSKAGGGLFALGGANYLVVSNNVITGNQGNYAGGVALGIQDNGWDNQNGNIAVRFNKIHRNGGVQGPGGVALNDFSVNYSLDDNIIAGNLSRFNGGGIAHRGPSPGQNYIRRNKILYNENFFGALLAKAGDGGGIYIGDDIVGGDLGVGNVTIDSNLIQGNLCGAGRGGGIRAHAVNGGDIIDNPTDPTLWSKLVITNNIIVNNVAALEGGGISLQDVVRATIENNTIVNNDTTATSALAFAAGQPNSTPQPSGIVAHAHSATLMSILAPWIATPAGAAEPVFADPALRNNIIRNNRSFFNDASLNGGAGGLAPNPTQPVWDLQVVGLANTYLDPDNCVLTSLTDTLGADYNDGSNVTGDPVFAREIVNELTTATVLDEGGNAITVRYTPLLPTVANYHINSGSSARDTGVDTGVTPDYDGEARPAGASYDIGADEYVAGTFTAVKVLAPTSGEVLPSGSAYTISWGAPATADHYRVLISTNGGGSWSLAANITGQTYYNWTTPIPADNLTRCIVRVMAYNAANAYIGMAQSAGFFTVEVLRLLTPNGGELLTGGSTYPVTWRTNATTAAVTSVRLERSLNNGWTWTPIATVAGNPETYSWTVPNTTIVQNNVRVRVVLLAGAAVVGRDVSDLRFTVRPQLVP